MFYPNKAYKGRLEVNSWRKMAMASWSTPKDPTIYGVMEINIESALKYIETQSKNSKSKITITHFFGKVFGELLRTYPEINSEIRLGKFYERKDISIAFQVAIDEANHPDDLTNALIQNIDQKNLSQIAEELSSYAKHARAERDPAYRRIKNLSSLLPGFLLRPAVKLLGFFMNSLNLWSPLFGIPQSAFGSLLITNVGSLGLDLAFAALYPPAGCPGIISIGKIYQGPVYLSDNQFVLKPHIRMCVTVDHRYVDGLHLGKCAELTRDIFANPEKYFS